MEDRNNLYKAINPYNFIPFEEEPVKATLDAYYGDPATLQSGWLDLRITAKTPLIIPDGSRCIPEPLFGPDGKPMVDRKGNQVVHKKYPFFRLPDGQYAIPGSSLRGMLRSLYEVATNSCLPFLMMDTKNKVGTPISQRTPLFAAFHKRGLLEYDVKKNSWILWQATSVRNLVSRADVANGYYEQNGKKYHNAQKVRFIRLKNDEINGFRIVPSDCEKAEEGILQFSIPVDPKAKYHVSVLIKGGKIKEWEPGNTEAFRSIHGSVYDSAITNLKRRPSPQLDLYNKLRFVYNEDLKQGKGGMIPVYYFTVNRGHETLYYLSGSAAGRVQQRKTWENIMKPYGPCESITQLCPACALFGTANGEGTKGRLRFSDAVLCTPDQPSFHMLQILNSPSPSAFEFYLRKPTDPEGLPVTYWNFDFYSVKRSEEKTVQEPDGKIKTETVTRTDYRDLPEATPRGRKMYWHGKPVEDSTKKDRMNTTMEAMPEGAAFTARIYFDRITEQRLRDLIWVITLGENDVDSKLQQKLGHAKPLGYGSVKLTITDCRRRFLRNDLTMRTETVDIPANPEPCQIPEGIPGKIDLDSLSVRALLKMCDTRSVGDSPVHYLYKNDYNGRPFIYEWFSQNRVNTETLQTLPEPLDEELHMDTVQPPWRRKSRSGMECRPNKQPEPLDDRTHGTQKMVSDHQKKPMSSDNRDLPFRRNSPSDASSVQKLAPGQTLKASVTGIKPYGFFVRLDDGRSGLVHIKNIKGCKSDEIDQFVKIGEDVEVVFYEQTSKGLSFAMPEGKKC